jgi:hypothetical protein
MIDLIIPLGPDIARFDDRNLYLCTSPEDMADALSRVGPADLRTIAQASPEVASAGLEAVIEALESSDTLASMERLLSLLGRLKGAARTYLTEVDEIYVGPVVATRGCDTYRPLTADERARIVAAVGDSPKAAMNAPLYMVEAFRKARTREGGTVLLLRSSLWTVPQVRAVACQLATTSPEEALAILEGARQFEVEG